MELNSDKDYYQKYIQYKHQYIMLKQLKNNNNYNYNDLEGGSWWQSIFGKSEATLAKEKRVKEEKEAKIIKEAEEARVQQEAEQLALEEAAYAATFSGDGTYLVFEVKEFTPDKYQFLKHLNYDNEKRKKENAKDGTDIVIMDKVEFSTQYKNAHLGRQRGRRR